MNKPKFRAWLKSNNAMYGVYGWDTSNNEIYLYSLPNSAFKGDRLRTVHAVTRPLDNVILMQYTGLKDKKGVEACQGNYLTREGRWTFFIEWLDEYGCLMAVPVNPIQRTNWEPVPIKRILEMGFVNDGNIHENPELLNEVE